MVQSIARERDLIAVAVALGAEQVGGALSGEERGLVASVGGCSAEREVVATVQRRIHQGEDPLGEAFCVLRNGQQRRKLGAFYTGTAIVSAILDWALPLEPTRLVDPGCGSGRFAVTARRKGFSGELVAVDIDPLATLITRAHLAHLGHGQTRVLNADFLTLSLPERSGRTAFVGNPPYVRHHDLDPVTKRWAKLTGARMGIRISGLAGLHALFILAAGRLSREGDIGSFITAAEWLDIRYGRALRQIFTERLGCRRLDLLNPEVGAFPDAMATALIVSWEVGHSGPAKVRFAQKIGRLAGGPEVSRRELAQSARWTDLVRRPGRSCQNGLVPLGSFARVHRGVVTGANDFFVLERSAAERHGLEHHVRPCVARASQIFSADGVLRADQTNWVLLDINKESELDPVLKAYLRTGEKRGLPKGYICSHRQPWWRVGGSPPPAIIATYMARQPPAFAANPDRCQILNVLHGIHFREEVEPELVAVLVDWLNRHREDFVGGRVYHGGLLKFEPKELEAILVPSLGQLRQRSAA